MKLENFTVTIRGVLVDIFVKAVSSKEALKKVNNNASWKTSEHPTGIYQVIDYCGSEETPFLAVVKRSDGIYEWFVNTKHPSSSNWIK
ncbi:MAG: hypothetical protein COB67_00540 [SAR324 cluster bacterium]|uniref:Uncharacterized protein n=1 Tax=SAR324 cluster bacterium TaxID=2024889 RepID=A0A2A4TBI3_9DELT|nr:MAG: hypothetical protein COB67_00540 [SAR324 cluster bacterium]